MVREARAARTRDWANSKVRLVWSASWISETSVGSLNFFHHAVKLAGAGVVEPELELVMPTQAGGTLAAGDLKFGPTLQPAIISTGRRIARGR